MSILALNNKNFCYYEGDDMLFDGIFILNFFDSNSELYSLCCLASHLGVKTNSLDIFVVSLIVVEALLKTKMELIVNGYHNCQFLTLLYSEFENFKGRIILLKTKTYFNLSINSVQLSKRQTVTYSQLNESFQTMNESSKSSFVINTLFWPWSSKEITSTMFKCFIQILNDNSANFNCMDKILDSMYIYPLIGTCEDIQGLFFKISFLKKNILNFKKTGIEQKIIDVNISILFHLGFFDELKENLEHGSMNVENNIIRAVLLIIEKKYDQCKDILSNFDKITPTQQILVDILLLEINTISKNKEESFNIINSLKIKAKDRINCYTLKSEIIFSDDKKQLFEKLVELENRTGTSISKISCYFSYILFLFERMEYYDCLSICNSALNLEFSFLSSTICNVLYNILFIKARILSDIGSCIESNEIFSGLIFYEYKVDECKVRILNNCIKYSLMNVDKSFYENINTEFSKDSMNFYFKLRKTPKKLILESKIEEAKEYCEILKNIDIVEYNISLFYIYMFCFEIEKAILVAKQLEKLKIKNKTSFIICSLVNSKLKHSGKYVFIELIMSIYESIKEIDLGNTIAKINELSSFFNNNYPPVLKILKEYKEFILSCNILELRKIFKCTFIKNNLGNEIFLGNIKLNQNVLLSSRHRILITQNKIIGIEKIHYIDHGFISKSVLQECLSR